VCETHAPFKVGAKRLKQQKYMSISTETNKQSIALTEFEMPQEHNIV